MLRISFASSIISDTFIDSIHLWSVGHSRFQHGEQSTGFLTILYLSHSGDVSDGSVEPKIATIGVPTAAAMCIGPESFVINR